MGVGGERVDREHPKRRVGGGGRRVEAAPPVGVLPLARRAVQPELGRGHGLHPRHSVSVAGSYHRLTQMLAPVKIVVPVPACTTMPGPEMMPSKT